MNSAFLLQQFYTDLITVLGFSENGAKTYVQSARIFLNWLENENIALTEVTGTQLFFFFAKRQCGGDAGKKADEDCGTKIAGRTVAKDIAALKAFGAFLVRKNYWKENTALLLERPSVNPSLPKVLSVEEVERFLSVIDVSTPLGVRDRAFFELVYSCGLRISEACSLRMSNLHLAERVVIVQGKGSKERMVPFGLEAKERLKSYLQDVRPSLLKNRIVEEIFLNYKGEPISRKGIWKVFQKYETLSGVEAKVHTLRHSFATHLLNGGMDLVSVSELLGHSNLATTTVYTHIEDNQIRQEHSEYFPGHKHSEVKNDLQEKV